MSATCNPEDGALKLAMGRPEKSRGCIQGHFVTESLRDADLRTVRLCTARVAQHRRLRAQDGGCQRGGPPLMGKRCADVRGTRSVGQARADVQADAVIAAEVTA